MEAERREEGRPRQGKGEVRVRGELWKKRRGKDEVRTQSARDLRGFDVLSVSLPNMVGAASCDVSPRESITPFGVSYNANNPSPWFLRKSSRVNSSEEPTPTIPISQSKYRFRFSLIWK